MGDDYEGDLIPDAAGAPVAAYPILNDDVRDPELLAAYRAAPTPPADGEDG